MKSLKDYLVSEQEERVDEAGKKFLANVDDIDASNPVVKKLLGACSKNGYKLLRAFCPVDANGKPRPDRAAIKVGGFGPGYHPEIRMRLNASDGDWFYIQFDLKEDIPAKFATAYAKNIAGGFAMLDVLNKVDLSKLPAIL